MNNLLKFLLTFALLLCAIFSIMLVFGCENEIQEEDCGDSYYYFYDKNLKMCAKFQCNEDKIIIPSDVDDGELGFCGCYNHNYILCDNKGENIIITPLIPLFSYSK